MNNFSEASPSHNYDDPFSYPEYISGSSYYTVPPEEEAFYSRQFADQEPPVGAEEATQLRDNQHRLELGRITTKLTQTEQRNEVLRHDKLTNMLTRAGFEDLLTHDPELFAELAAPLMAKDPETQKKYLSGELPGSGVEYGDIRGVKEANTRGGDSLGDLYIARGTVLIAETLATNSRQRERRSANLKHLAAISHDTRSGEDRREGPAKYPDKLIRRGGDEGSGVARSITPTELLSLDDRVADSLGIKTAIERYNNTELPLKDRVPIIAGFGSAHITELYGTPYANIETPADLYRAYERLHEIAADRQAIIKQRQYSTMRRMITDHYEGNGEMPPDLSDDRKVTGHFWKEYFPDFYNDPHRFLQESN